MLVPGYEICPGVYYLHKMDHRDGSHEKSQWIISVVEERVCFECSYKASWCSLARGWGLHFKDGQVDYLGRTGSTVSESRNLFIAKFVDGNGNDKWHGYPADHVIRSQDIPPEWVLKIWLDKNYVDKKLARKIASGQKCKLNK